ncbi:MAG: hypothetical protein ABIH36_00140 [bacterium]
MKVFRLSGANILVFFFIVAVALAFSWPVLMRLPNTGIWDWSEAMAHYEAARLTIFQYGQFPLWNPYMCGGGPALANPQTYWLSLTGALAIFIDPVIGSKLAIPIYLIIGGIGMYFWVRQVGASRLGACMSIPIFLTSGFMATHLSAGQFLWLTLAWVPWIFWGYCKSRKMWWWLVLAAAFLTMIGLEGRSYLVLYVAIALISYAIIKDIVTRGKSRAMLRALLLLGIAFGLGAWKFVPDLFFLSQSLDKLSNTQIIPVRLFFDMFLLRDVTPNALYFSNYLLENVPWFEFGYYVGIVPLVLAVIAFITHSTRKKIAAWLSILVTFVYVVLSDPAHSLMEHLPIIDELRNQQRAAIMIVFIVALFSAFGVDAFKQLWPRRLVRILPILQAALVIYVLVDLLTVTSGALAQGFGQVIEGDGVPPPVLSLITQGTGADDPWSMVKQNRGAADFCPAILSVWYNEREVRPVGDEKYQGEVYLQGPGQLKDFLITPNEIIADVAAPAGTLLVVNQNSNPGWHSNVGKIVRDGSSLLAVDLPPGEQEVVLNYLPPGIGYGLLLTILTIASVGIMLLFRRRRFLRGVYIDFV